MPKTPKYPKVVLVSWEIPRGDLDEAYMVVSENPEATITEDGKVQVAQYKFDRMVTVERTTRIVTS